MNWDLIFALVFYGLLFLFFITHRKKFEVQGKIFVLYKTRLGLKLMDKFSRITPRFLEYIGYIGVFVGFIGMIFIFYVLIKGSYDLLVVPDAAPALAPLLPGVQLPGLPVISFWHWIIAIFVLAVVHEFSHGLYSRLFKVKVKSSGFAFLGPILAAFVEPEEKTLGRRTKMQQLSVFAAGPFSNIVLGIIVFLIYSFLLIPIASSLNESVGVEVVLVQEGFPAFDSGLQAGEKIISVNNNNVESVDDFTSYLGDLKSGDNIIIQTEENDYGVEAVENPNVEGVGYLGISVRSINEISEDTIEKYGTFLPNVFMWVFVLFFWLYIANIGVGLFNLLPLAIVDGGRMFYVGSLGLLKNEKVVKKLFSFITIVVLLLILVNLWPWISKLISFFNIPLMIFG